MGLATGLEQTLVDNFFAGSGPIHSGTLELGILQGGSEWAYQGYARQPIQATTHPTSGTIYINNGTTASNAINFPTVATAAVTADEWGLYDSSNTLVFSESAGGVTVNVGDYATIPADTITLTVT